MRKVYTSPEGAKQYNRPECVVTKATKRKPSVYIYSPSDEQIVAAGWTIKEEIVPIPEPYVPTVEELVERALRYGEDGGTPTYSINQEFEVQRKRDTEPEAYAAYYARVEACISWAKSQPHRAEEGK